MPTIPRDRRRAVAGPFPLLTAGHLLAMVCQSRGLYLTDVAAMTGRPVQALSEIAHGHKRVTAETALQLEQALAVPARVWLACETESAMRAAEGAQ